MTLLTRNAAGTAPRLGEAPFPPSQHGIAEAGASE
jgi:hypothetical protein